VPRPDYDPPPGGDAVTVRLLEPSETRTIPAADIAMVHRFEDAAAERVRSLLDRKDDAGAAEAAERLAAAALQVQRGRRVAMKTDPLLADQLVAARRHLLHLLSPADALRRADAWGGPDGPLRDDVRALWVRQADVALKAANFAAARRMLDRLEQATPRTAQAGPIRAALQNRAEGLLKESKGLDDAQAVRVLQDALAAWPRLPGLRDELERRRGTYRVLYVAVRALPERLSPATATTDVERQCLELLFQGLVEVRTDAAQGRYYRPVLAERLPPATGVDRAVRLRRDVYWSDGEHFTTADIRHTVQLLTRPDLPGRTTIWRELLEPPRFEGDPFGLEVVYRQGLLDPLAPLRFAVLPQQFAGKPLLRADDPEFAKHPVGTGPFVYAGRKTEDGRTYAVFRANPHYLRGGQASPGPIREIRLFAWAGIGDPGTPAPHVVLDPPPGQVAGLRKAGLTDVRALPDRRVYYLGINHRVASLASPDVRRAIAHAIDRQALLKQHFAADGAVAPRSANGPFPRGCWLAAPAPRVPEEMYQPELARSFAKKAKVKTLEWTLKYPADEPRLASVCADLAGQIRTRFQEAGVALTITPVPLPPHRLREALDKRDFDLVYHHLNDADSPYALAVLFDPHPSAVREGGSNYLGYDHDAKLQSTLRAALHHRQFSAARDLFHDLHAHLTDTMPLVPLWQAPDAVAIHSSLHVPPLGRWSVFADVLEWKLAP
jgi:ABC-type transport system substrate-binding protein